FAGGGKEAGSGTSIESIRKAGILRVGVKSDVPKFGLVNTTTNQYEGIEIELARLIAKEILGDANKVVFTPVTAKTRGPLLDMGEIDIVIATFSIAAERKLIYNFSPAYYTDTVGMLVKKSSGISGLKDCNGKTIGVAQSATSLKAIQEEADRLNITVNFSEFATYPEIKMALDSSQVDVFSVDKAILSGYLDDTSVILPDSFAPQNYGIATRLDDKNLAAYINELVETWLSDGTIGGLIRRFDL
ncbi:MAG: transporter substrate-binding domain-containing protein, partial [Spirochaetales bacterium]|nr:transporter substrate-binding domain-containing protein [Spirochaetales bacterium]